MRLMLITNMLEWVAMDKSILVKYGSERVETKCLWVDFRDKWERLNSFSWEMDERRSESMGVG